MLRDGTTSRAYVDIAGTLAGIVIGPHSPPADVAALKAGAANLGLDPSLVARLHWRNGYPSPLPDPESLPPRV